MSAKPLPYGLGQKIFEVHWLYQKLELTGREAIDTAAQFALRVIHVDALHACQTNDTVKFTDGRGVSFWRSKIVPGGEEMAGVETYPDTILFPDAVKNLAQLLESPADARTLTGRCFEEDHRPKTGAVPMHLIERIGNTHNSGTYRGTVRLLALAARINRQLEIGNWQYLVCLLTASPLSSNFEL